MYKSATILTVFLLLLSVSLNASNDSIPPKPATINWMSWSEVQAKADKGDKKVMLAVYTEWCTWCKRMDELTFDVPELAQYINDNFYSVKFDAQTKEELVYKDQVFKYVKNGKRGYHELAAFLLKGRLSYPTVVFLDNEMDFIQSIVGFKTATQFEQISTYFATDQYKKTPWSIYVRDFRPSLFKDRKEKDTTLIKD